MMKINLKQMLCSLTLSLFIAMHSTAANSDTADTLSTVYQMQALSFGVLGDYYMFSGLEGDSRYSRQIDVGIKQFEDAIGKVTAEGSPTAKLDSLGTALAHWQTFKNLVETNRNDFLTQGYSNARLVGELSIEVKKLNSSLQSVYDGLIDKTQFPLSKQTKDIRKMGLIIQTITAEYAARNTSNLGQVLAIDINEGGMDSQAKIFNKLLTDLKQIAKPDKRIYKLTDQIDVKWSFINKSVANYNENAVPFIVNTYGERITQNLQNIESHFANKMQAKK